MKSVRNKLYEIAACYRDSRDGITYSQFIFLCRLNQRIWDVFKTLRDGRDNTFSTQSFTATAVLFNIITDINISYAVAFCLADVYKRQG